MNSTEFVIWLKGFTEGVHEFNVTPKQWDLLKEKLAQVSDKGTPVGVGGQGIPNMWQHPHYVDPLNPYKVTCKGPETPTGTTITTTPNTAGYITVANPYVASFGGTSTATSYPTGSTVSWTVNGDSTQYSIKVNPCIGHALASDEIEEELNKRMDVIGQNGNEGLHYNIEEDGK